MELPRPLSINTQALAINNTLKLSAGAIPLFVGATQRYTNAELQLNLGSNALPPEIGDLLTDKITTSGAGLVAEFDTHDNIFTPATGYHYTLEYLLYREGIGSDIDYDLTHLEGLNYWRLADAWRLGFRFEGEIAESDETLPRFAQPSMTLRGIPAARYQGSYVGVIETEVTWKVDSRWIVLNFAGAGRAAASGSECSDAPNRVTRGVWFRYQIARSYGFHMGLDIARGPEDTIFYMQAGSA